MSDERLLATPAGVRLGPVEAIAIDAARSFVLKMKTGRFHGFVVRRGAGVYGYVDRCPHMGLPLAQQLDSYLAPSGDAIVCSWHSALFDIESGRCVGGPCAGKALRRWPVVVENGYLVTASTDA